MYKAIMIFILLTLPVYGMSNQEAKQLKQDVELLCAANNRPCTVAYDSLNKAQAYTRRDGTIIITQGLKQGLTFNEAKAVALHEVGHHVLKHYDRGDKFIYDWYLSKDKLIKFRHNMEYEADLFATRYALQHNQFNYLPQALKRLTLDDNESSETHPSANERIKKMNMYTDYMQSSYIKRKYL